MTETDPPAKTPSAWKSPNVWASPRSFETNQVRQLLVPASEFTEVGHDDDGLLVSNRYGSWRAASSGTDGVTTSLYAKLPLGTKAGDALSRAAWEGPSEVVAPADVRVSYGNALSFAVPSSGLPSLRRPQLGAVHAVLGYWTTKRTTPATVVMPTGTGKTETMLALLVAAAPERLLVLVPSDALREQISDKFLRLGVLQELGIVSSAAQRPNVGVINSGFKDVQSALGFAAQSNVIVSTPNALKASTPAALEALLGECSHLFVDEAHHVAARQWTEIRAAFQEKPVVQFTATPFREDGKHLAGRIIYTFPLREAQADKYFSHIDYASVIDFDDVDRAVAVQSLARLRDDLKAGRDHVLMARVATVPRTIEVLKLYQELAPDLEPVRMFSGMPQKARRDGLAALGTRKSRVVICVNMLGEGFDLPALKIAAVHDAQKSLGVTLQFIGRFARTSSGGEFGTASVFVARTEIDVDRRLRALYAEDSDWNKILRDLTETVVDAQQDVSDFEAHFTSLPEDVTVQSLLPKMSTVVYRTETNSWAPEAIADFFGEENLLTVPIGLNMRDGVAWCVVENRQDVRWGNLRQIEEVTYQLYVLYFDSSRRLLYINHSANAGVFEELAEAVGGTGVKRFTGSTVYRVMADIDRLIPTTVGVVDARDQFKRFSMHVGSDVTASFSEAEAGTKAQTNISGGGYRKGDYVSISASLKGRIWSHSTASSLKAWCNWCDEVGTKLLDDSISIDSVIKQFILPVTMDELPEGVLLALEWPWEVHLMAPEGLKLAQTDKVYPLPLVDIVPDTSRTSGPFQFTFSTDAWSVTYKAELKKSRLVYSCVDATELTISSTRKSVPLSEWLNDQGLTFILERDRVIEGNLLLAVNVKQEPFSRSRLVVHDWTGVDLKVEAQKAAKLADSIQYRAIELLKAERDWDVMIDDDGSGEIADIVAMKLEDNVLTVRLVHCKYAGGGKAGARVGDLYEVCGQTQKSIIWRKQDLEPFFKTLAYRAKKKVDRTGVNPFEVGDLRALFGLRDKAQVASRKMQFTIVQPGLSAAKSSDQQLELLASTETYLKTTVSGSLEVWTSA